MPVDVRYHQVDDEDDYTSASKGHVINQIDEYLLSKTTKSPGHHIIVLHCVYILL